MVSVFEKRAVMPQGNVFERRAKETGQRESFGKSAFRTAYQVPSGIAQGFTYPADILQQAGVGEATDPEFLEHLRKIYEREGIPFDEEKYLEEVQNAASYFPTQSNIERGIEEKTGAPLQPQTRLQKGVKFASTAGKLAPKPGTFRGINVSLPKPVLGAGVEGAKEVLQELGLPEPISELASFGVLKKPSAGAASLSIGQKTKPSGLKERGFERVQSPKEISGKQLEKINKKVEKNFRDISEKIIEESPIGETAENLKNDPTFKQESRELLNEAQSVADEIPGTLQSKWMKKELADTSSKHSKGFAPSEYDKSYKKFMNQAVEDISENNMSAGQIVEQYRKNNQSLGEYFEPGASQSLNRAKRDALLDQNRAIASLMEKAYPESELVPIFREGNERWTKIMDAEAVDDFVNEIFSGKINYKKLHDFFNKTGYDRIFKRALGEKGFKDFQQVIKDMLTSEVPYKMLKVAEQKGFQDLFTTASAYLIHPTIGKAKTIFTAGKYPIRYLMNSLLDKPQLSITWKSGIDNLKKGKFPQAERDFEKMEKELASVKSSEILLPEKMGEPKLIEYKEPINPTPKQQHQKAVRNIFDEALSGNKLSPVKKNMLKDTKVALLETRGSDKQFHGSRKPIKELNPNIHDVSGEQNIYGDGFYTTDALDIADGYSKAKFAKEPVVYSVKETKPQKIYDAESKIDEFKKWYKTKDEKYLSYMKDKHPESKNYETGKKYKDLSYNEYVKKDINIVGDVLYNENPKSVRELYDKVRERGIEEGVTAYEMQDYFTQIKNLIEENGYDGLSHKGGILTNNPAHNVKIYWKPENLEIQEFSYPKEFKKTHKIYNSNK